MKTSSGTAGRSPSHADQANTTNNANGSTVIDGFHGSRRKDGPRCVQRMASPVAAPATSGRRPRRHANTPRPRIAPALASADANSIVDDDWPSSRYGTANSQKSSGPGWFHPKREYGPRGVSRSSRRPWSGSSRTDQSPAGNQVRPAPSIPDMTTGATQIASRTVAASTGHRSTREPPTTPRTRTPNRSGRGRSDPAASCMARQVSQPQTGFCVGPTSARGRGDRDPVHSRLSISSLRSGYGDGWRRAGAGEPTANSWNRALPRRGRW